MKIILFSFIIFACISCNFSKKEKSYGFNLKFAVVYTNGDKDTIYYNIRTKTQHISDYLSDQACLTVYYDVTFTQYDYLACGVRKYKLLEKNCSEE